MAGGVSTPALVSAVAAASGMGMLAAGYRTAGAVAAEIEQTRQLIGDRPFGVNLFVPHPPPEGAARQDAERALAAYRERLSPLAASLHVTLPEPDWAATDHYDAKVALLTLVSPVPVVSFTFGCPTREVVDQLHAVGSCVLVTVTSPEEGQTAADAGADGLVVQGFEAGGHRSTHDVSIEPNKFDHLVLLPMVAEVGLPMLAAGGVTTAGDVRRAAAAGAVGVVVGTAFLLTDEAGTPAAYRMGLSDPALGSVVTRAFSGRYARGLRNQFVAEHDGFAPAVFPQVDQMTKPLRAAASADGRIGGVSLWAGAGWRAAREEPAAQVVRRLSAPTTR